MSKNMGYIQNNFLLSAKQTKPENPEELSVNISELFSFIVEDSHQKGDQSWVQRKLTHFKTQII